MAINRIEIPRQASTALRRPLTVRLSLPERRQADLLASMKDYPHTSTFLRVLLSSCAEQMQGQTAA